MAQDSKVNLYELTFGQLQELLAGWGEAPWVKGLATDVDRVMVDPPRSGLGPAVRFHLVERPPKEIS